MTVGRARAARWLSLAAVALAVLVMHHPPVAHDAHPVGVHATQACQLSPTASDEPPMAGMLPECLAVLSKWLVVVLLVGVACGAAEVWRRELARVGRPPDGRATLHSVGVLRL